MAVLPSFYILERRGKKKMNYLGEGFNIISKGLIAFGGVWTVWGIVVMAGGLNDHNGQDIKQGVLRAVGGALIIAAAAWLTTINVNFG
ncbi:hypothetical protein [Holdemanella biformis]|uniref:hypothetical protein n=1 Tax=Holdemanella biformis TaxID=1735 RepID=UPI001C391FC1|nr:hypothetical protein [Holdemanella biformis]MBV4131367.1 hypothetical protein [Holdemanella biformis]MBV4151119.1 hypothetical protein [Holdemanella biformis]